MSKRWKPEPGVALSLPCTGHMSEPKQNCDKSIIVMFPFNLERLTAELKRAGWFVTIATPAGVSPPVMSVLCGECADALIPDLTKATREAWGKLDS